MQKMAETLLKDQCLVHGRWTKEPRLEVLNPAKGAVAGCGPDFGAAGARAAIKAANVAHPVWRPAGHGTGMRPFELADDRQYENTTDILGVWRVAEGLEYGMIGTNEGIVSTELAPFGGVKETGLRREGSHHRIKAFQELKYLMMGGL